MSATYPPNPKPEPKPEPLAEAVQACLDGDMTLSGTIAHSEYFGERVAQVLKSAGWTYTPPKPPEPAARTRTIYVLDFEHDPRDSSSVSYAMSMLFTNNLARRLRPWVRVLKDQGGTYAATNLHRELQRRYGSMQERLSSPTPEDS